jgi:hypothetical protein
MKITREAATSDLIVSIEDEATRSLIYREDSMEFRSKKGSVATASFDIYGYYPEYEGKPEDPADPDGPTKDVYRGHFTGSKHLTAAVVIDTEGWLDA